jgi:PilZ domain
VANKNGKINIYDVNSLLFKIISVMSESERRKLHALLVDRLSDTRNGKDLSSLITSISEAKRYELVGRLINWYRSKKSKLRGHYVHVELRGYPRKQLKIPVELSKNGFTFMCLTQNISNSGAFIQTDFNFQIHQHINMTFSPPNSKKDITVGGEIVRIGSKGIGAKFDELLSLL